jgi:hypothetical protein
MGIFLEHLFRDIRKKFMCKIDQYKIYLVDTNKIRDKSKDGDDFNDFGVSLRYKFIPKNEIWLSYDVKKEEQHFLIWNAINQYERYKTNKKDYEDYAYKIEKAEREKSSGIKMNKHHIKEDIYVKEYCKIGNQFTVWLVNGELVRDEFETAFVLGGNPFVYPWIPKKEIWVENDVTKTEIPCIILHEYVESMLMQHKKMPYNKAHYKAISVDWSHRGKFNKQDVEELTPEKALKMAKQ